MKPEHTKPFDLNLAKYGAPYAQRNGFAARIGIWDKKGEFPLLGLRDDFHGQECVGSWKINGQNLHCPGQLDLVMLPLGYCEGKPVFVGDELVYINSVIGSIVMDAECSHFVDFKWPRTAPVMPIFFACSDQQKSVEYALLYDRSKIEAYWKALDEFNGVKA